MTSLEVSTLECCGGRPMELSLRVPARRPAIPSKIFRNFLQHLQRNEWIVPPIKSSPLTSTFFQFVSCNHSVIRRPIA